MDIIFAIIAIVMLFMYIDLRLRVADLKAEQDSDGRHFESWLRDLEQRKADKIDEDSFDFS